MEASMQTAAIEPLAGNVQNDAIAGVSAEEKLMNEAIMRSIAAQKENINANTYEPLNAEDRKRENGVPAGLKNIGNTCYFNSLLQVYYNMPEFVNLILSYEDDNIPL